MPTACCCPRTGAGSNEGVAGPPASIAGIYRDALVEATPDGPNLGASAWLSPVQAPGAPEAPTYRADLMTGQITTTGPVNS